MFPSFWWSLQRNLQFYPYFGKVSIQSLYPSRREKQSLPAPNFVFYGFFGQVTLTPRRAFKLTLALLVAIVLGSTAVNLTREGSRMGLKRVFKMFIRPTFEAYALAKLNPGSTYSLPATNLAWIAVAVAAAFAALRLRKPAARMATLRRLPTDDGSGAMFTAPPRVMHCSSGGGRSDPTCAPLLPRWNWHGFYFVSDWAFFAVLSVAVTQALAPMVLKWWKAEAVVFSTILPTAISDGAAEYNIDLIFGALFVLLFGNLLPTLRLASCSTIGMLFVAIFCPRTLPTVPAVPFSRWGYTYNNPSKEPLLELTLGAPREVPGTGGVVEVEGTLVGTPGSRICTLQPSFAAAAAGAGVADPSLALWVLDADESGDPQDAMAWRPETYEYGYSDAPVVVFAQHGTVSPPSSASPAAGLPRIRVPFLVRYNSTIMLHPAAPAGATTWRAGPRRRERLSGLEQVEAACYHGEVEDVGGLWGTLQARQGGWMKPTHGKFGGAVVVQRVKVDVAT
ncbi:hypothetical protein DFJ73DRAFT_763933 [Zopfochytrium polystomum]|nr:hypothetical protein DFJ73DRAFT_763933 [Zopfochytrium polystomum]